MEKATILFHDRPNKPAVSRPRGSGTFGKPNLKAERTTFIVFITMEAAPAGSLPNPLREDTKMPYLKPLFTASIIAISLASLPAISWATEQGQQRQQARDTRQQARPEARQTKQDCRAANQKSNAACRQDKRHTKQDARKTGRAIKY